MTAEATAKPKPCHGLPALDDLSRQIDHHEKSANKLRRLFRLLQELRAEGTIEDATPSKEVSHVG